MIWADFGRVLKPPGPDFGKQACLGSPLPKREGVGEGEGKEGVKVGRGERGEAVESLFFCTKTK